MIKLVKVGQRMLIDLDKISFIDLQMIQPPVGSAYLKARVIIDGNLNYFNQFEMDELLAALKLAGVLHE